MKHRSDSKNGMGFYLREQGIGDKCGKALVSIWGGKELINGEIWLGVGRKQNVGDVVQGYEFCNITLLVRLIHQIRKCHRPKYVPHQGG